MPEPLLKVLQQMKLAPKELLQPDPFLEFHEEIPGTDGHRYYDLKKKHWVPHSVSALSKDSTHFLKTLAGDYGESRKQTLLEATERGTVVHACIEQYWKTGTAGHGGKYQPWVEQFMSDPLLKNYECVACEYRLVDRIYDIAGSLDFLLENKENKHLVLCDLKTKKKGFTKNHMEVKTQLGGYLSLLGRNWPSIDVKSCRVYWVTDESIESDEYDIFTCWDLYTSARKHYRSKQLPDTY